VRFKEWRDAIEAQRIVTYSIEKFKELSVKKKE
jgi:hypothetical protein